MKDLKFPTDTEYPEGYEWFAYDLDGRGCFYKVKPYVKRNGVWYPESNSAMDYDSARSIGLPKFELDFDVENWKETLRKKGQSTIDKPNYYTWHPLIECRKVIELFPANLAMAVKYICRVANPQASKYDSVDQRVEDLNKAINFLKFEIERLQESEGE
jgi:hypothetical protein